MRAVIVMAADAAGCRPRLGKAAGRFAGRRERATPCRHHRGRSDMDILAAKLIMAVVIFAFGMTGGLLPRMLGQARHGDTLLVLGSGFAGGVFLGAGFIHLLGDSHEYFAEVTAADYPLFLMVGGVGFLLILLIEKVLARAEETDAAGGAHPFILLLVLSLHSFIAGTALGLESNLFAAVVLLVAIVAHKSFAAFALGISFIESGLARRRYLGLLATFSIMTPLGLLLGTALSDALQSDTALELEAIFDGLAGGTFIYVATMDVLGRTFDGQQMRWQKYAAIAAGFGLMAVLAIWS